MTNEEIVALLKDMRAIANDLNTAADDEVLSDLCARIDAALSSAGRLVGEGWKDAVIDQLVICHLYNATHDEDPKKAIDDLISWHVTVALDPRVSAAARALVFAPYSAREAFRYAYMAAWGPTNDREHKEVEKAEEDLWCEFTAAAPHPAPDATDWKARCELLLDDALRWKDMYLAVAKERDALTAAQAENERLRAALIAAREAILSLRDTRWSEAEGTDDEWVGYIDYALSPPPLSPEKP